MTDSQLQPYVECLTKQLEEVNMLSSIYCNPGEMHIFDPSVIIEFNEFIQKPSQKTFALLKAYLDYSIALPVLIGSQKDKVELRIILPPLYPRLETATFTIHTPLLTKPKETYLKKEMERFVDSLEKQETYVYQVISWLQDQLEHLIESDSSKFESETKEETKNPDEEIVDFERLWIYSHHIKSKAKRHEIIKQSKALELSGFCRPGKPGIICVEGLKENTEEFWRIIRQLNWQKLIKCKSEVAHKPKGKLDKLRRFEGFKEQLFCDDLENEDGVMDMSSFIKFLEFHKSGYMKKELFGIE